PGSSPVLIESSAPSGGIDTIDFSGAETGLTFSLEIDDGTPQPVDAAAGRSNTVAITGAFEDLVGSLYNDKLSGNGLHNNLPGNGGLDLIFGGGGNDSITGGSGNDTLIGGDGNDLIIGGGGDNTIVGSGDDSLSGGGNDL